MQRTGVAGALPTPVTERVIVNHQRAQSGHRRLMSGMSESSMPVPLPMPLNGHSRAHSRVSSGQGMYYLMPNGTISSQQHQLPRAPAYGLGGYSRMPPTDIQTLSFASQQYCAGDPSTPMAENRSVCSPSPYRAGRDYNRYQPLGVEAPARVIIYHEPNEWFFQREGAMELLCIMLGAPVEKIAVAGETRSLFRSLRFRSGGLLAPIFPIVCYRERNYVQWLASARVLARDYKLYGVDANGDYYNDAILDCIRPWLEDQAVALTAYTKAQRSMSNEKGEQEIILGYMSQRSIYYQCLNQMFESYAHPYRSEELGTTWIDPLILAGIVDDLVLDIKVGASANSATYLSEDSKTYDFYIIMTNSLNLTPLKDAVDAKLDKARKSREDGAGTLTTTTTDS